MGNFDEIKKNPNFLLRKTTFCKMASTKTNKNKKRIAIFKTDFLYLETFMLGQKII